MTNEVKIEEYTFKISKELVKQFTFQDLEIYLTFDSKTKKFKELDIELDNEYQLNCKTLDKELTLKLFNFLKENLGELMK